MTAPNDVLIIMATYNGAAFLPEQLQSIANQDGITWRLRVSDDGSTDATCDVVAEFSQLYPKQSVLLSTGPKQGFAANFLSLLGKLDHSTDFVAFADQDDIWQPDKLTRALSWLNAENMETPALYTSRTWAWFPKNGYRVASPHFKKSPSFRNALTQSLAGGNTMVLNRAAAALAKACSHEAGPIISHDWWIYQIITGAGGTVYYDPEPSLDYRQHEANLVGANIGWAARWRRAKMIRDGVYQTWHRVNIAALDRSAHRFTPENRAILNEFAVARQQSLLKRIRRLARLGLYRQSLGANITFWLAVIFGRI
jgi:glycosyltransferase involved in cell wall biosynthesis